MSLQGAFVGRTMVVGRLAGTAARRPTGSSAVRGHFTFSGHAGLRVIGGRRWASPAATTSWWSSGRTLAARTFSEEASPRSDPTPEAAEAAHEDSPAASEKPEMSHPVLEVVRLLSARHCDFADVSSVIAAASHLHTPQQIVDAASSHFRDEKNGQRAHKALINFARRNNLRVAPAAADKSRGASFAGLIGALEQAYAAADFGALGTLLLRQGGGNLVLSWTSADSPPVVEAKLTMCVRALAHVGRPLAQFAHLIRAEQTAMRAGSLLGFSSAFPVSTALLDSEVLESDPESDPLGREERALATLRIALYPFRPAPLRLRALEQCMARLDALDLTQKNSVHSFTMSHDSMLVLAIMDHTLAAAAAADGPKTVSETLFASGASPSSAITALVHNFNVFQGLDPELVAALPEKWAQFATPESLMDTLDRFVTDSGALADEAQVFLQSAKALSAAQCGKSLGALSFHDFLGRLDAIGQVSDVVGQSDTSDQLVAELWDEPNEMGGRGAVLGFALHARDLLAAMAQRGELPAGVSASAAWRGVASLLAPFMPLLPTPVHHSLINAEMDLLALPGADKLDRPVYTTSLIKSLPSWPEPQMLAAMDLSSSVFAWTGLDIPLRMFALKQLRQLSSPKVKVPPHMELSPPRQGLFSPLAAYVLSKNTRLPPSRPACVSQAYQAGYTLAADPLLAPLERMTQNTSLRLPQDDATLMRWLARSTIERRAYLYSGLVHAVKLAEQTDEHLIPPAVAAALGQPAASPAPADEEDAAVEPAVGAEEPVVSP